jgi:HAD superfamily hydrolase (TIGR01509 family)
MFDLATTRRMFCVRGADSSKSSQPPTASGSGRTAAKSPPTPRGHATPRPNEQRCGQAQVRGLLFDMGDVLYDATLWRRWLFQLLGRMGLHAHYRTMFRVWDEEFLDDVHRGRREFAEAFQAFLLSLGLSRGQSDEVQAASQARKRELEMGARPLPGVRDTVERLAARGIKLAVLSDAEQSGDELQTQLARLGLAGRFSPVISSIDLEYTKPSAVCYRAALSSMELPTQTVAFVGHDGAELAGARAVGLRTIAYNYDAGAAADHYLTRFEELLQVVDPNATGADPLVTAA